MSKENPQWGAARIHGELLMLGFEVAQSTVFKAAVAKLDAFRRNDAEAIAAIDLCVVPTLTFDRLFAFLVLGHGPRQLLWIEVTRHPTAEWLARQITEAFTWTSAPAYLVRDNDGAYGHVFTSRVRAMGIRDRPISPRSPWQNGYAERLIGTLRRECLNRMLIFGEAHLRRVLASYAAYYNQVRTHLKSETIGCDASATKPFYRLLYRVPALCTTRLARGKRSKQRAPSQANRGSKKQGRSEVPLHVSAPNRKHSHG
jgi:Integrase core domain